MSTETPMRIIELRANNFKRLSAVRITPHGNVVRIEGRNAQGKSSVLDAIEAALGGARHSPEVPVRNGTSKATVVLDLGDLIVERTYTAKGGTALEVRTKDGVPQKSPQAMLDQLIGDIGFDPEGFVRLKPADQIQELKRLVGIDFSELDAKRETIYHQRKATNTELRSAQASIGDAPVFPSDLPAARVSMVDLTTEYEAGSRANQERTTLGDKLTKAEAKRDGLASEIELLQAKLRDTKAQLASADSAIATGRETYAKMTVVDLSGISERMKALEATNAMIEARDRFRAARTRIDSLETVAQGYTDEIEQIDDRKRSMLAAAKFPLDGLSINESGVTLKGLPFAQASQAEQLRASVAIALAQRPKLRVILVRDGSRMDNASLKLLAEIAEEYDAQVFVERVADERSPSAVVIEDGEVVQEPEATAETVA